MMILPLSINQREIYLEQMMWPEGSHLNIGAIVIVDGELKVEVVSYAINKIISCYPAVRTRIYELDGKPLQTIAPYQEKPIPLIDFSADQEGEKLAAEYIKQEFIKPFSFGENSPLADFQIIRINPQKYIIFGRYHHAITDGWGTSIFFREFIDIYNQIINTGTDNKTQQDWVIKEYLQEENNYLESRHFQSDRLYWTKRLEGINTQLFPLLKPQQIAGNRRSVYIKRENYNKVNALCQANQSNVFHFILGLVGIYLAKRYHQDDIVFGLSLLNRSKKIFKDAIGLFVSTIPFRLPINQQGTIQELLDQIRSLLRQDYRHQKFPVGEMRRICGLQSGSKEHLYEVYLSYERHDYNEAFVNSETSCIPLYSYQQKVPLIIYVREYNEQSDIKIDFDYNLSYLDEQTIELMMANFQQIFEQAGEDLTQTVNSLAVKLPQIETQITPVFLQSQESLVSAFEAIAQNYPTNPAVQYRHTTLTYTELNTQANRLAHYLISQGVQPETRVGLCLERSENIVIAILAILKAGAAYVPIDPNYPSDRLQLILQDSGISALIAEKSVLEQITINVTAFTLDAIKTQLSQQPHISPAVEVKPEFPAYIIYTSGSTGTPKGCVVTHHNAVRLMRSTENWFGFNETDIWTVFHSFAFDFSVWELWGGLLYGGKVIIVPFWLSRSPESFREFLSTEKVTVLNQTPSAFYQLIRADEASSEPLALRYIIFGGEALDLPSLSPWLERYGDKKPQLINMYGITETTVHVTYRPISRQDLLENRGSVIGVPIPDLRVYLLDEKMSLVPDGVAGEIYVAGAGVTMGYLNRPQLTAERFLDNPFGEGKIYRSGDLARRLPSGDLEYLGRIDNQVKIRGFRIELGEIQAALTSHPEVREAFIIVEGEEEKRLIAYYVAGEYSPNPNELRQYLKAKLPDHFIPAAYVNLEAFPLTINGKIDTKALPAPDWNLLRVEDEYVAPRNTDEESLCQIVSGVLGLEKVGIDDNFFEIGGDSILALQVIAKAKKAGFAITTRDLYESATVRQLATKKAVIASVSSAEKEVISLLSPSDKQKLPATAADAYPLSSLQLGMLYHTELHPDAAIFHQVFTFDLKLPYDEVAWQKAVKDICQANPVLRTSFNWTGYSIPVQIVEKEINPPLTITDLRNLGENPARQQVKSWIEDEKKRQFDISKAPLFRLQIHRLTNEQISFSFSFHHVILDGWSVATLLTQLLQQYVQYLIVENAKLPNLPDLTYRDFIIQEQQAISHQPTREFWQQYLSNFQVNNLPRFTKSTTEKPGVKQREILAINDKLTNDLRALAKNAGVPLKTVLLAVHLRVLSFLTEQTEIVTGNVLNTRPETLDSQNILGLFVNTIPFRIDLQKRTWWELIQKVFQGEKEILTYRNFPLAEMQRLIDQRPLFDAVFNYIHYHVYDGLLNLSSVEVLDIDIFEETDFPFLVEFCLLPQNQALQLSLIYDDHQFSAEQVKQYSQYYQTALTEIVTHTYTEFNQRSLISPVERNNLLQAANWQPVNYPPSDTLVSAFAQNVIAYPQKSAVCFENQILTFAELDANSNRLAHYLQEQGITPGCFVGLCLQRSEQLIIAILAILKAGAAYVPIDPTYPSDRINFLLQDSGVSLVITQQAVVENLPQNDKKIVVLEAITTELENQSSQPLNIKIQAHYPAYIIYTSGSTGTPKGCIVSHGNVIRLLKATENWFKFNSSDVWTLFHSYAFDFSVWEMWGALTYGGKVVVVPYWTSRNPEEFLQLLETEQVTVLNQTPSAFKQLIPVAKTNRKQLALRYVIFGGEALELPSLLPWFELYGDDKPKLINMYGITETTVHVTYKPISREDAIANRGSLIGEPIPDLNLYILDQNLEPSPVGVVGEMYIGGAGVTQGYLHQPRLSAERFIPDPFTKTPGSRLYRSGDLARRLPDGEIEYLGRSDQQIKIRGFRIELGEITAALNTHPHIQQALATIRTTNNGENRIVGYFVADTPAEIKAELPTFLKTKLPDYMIPTTFVNLENLPLTVNGKIDYQSLPVPDWSWTNKTYIAPRNDREKTICSLMAALLKVERVGINDDFFELGGDSLLVTQLVVKLRETYQNKLPLMEFFTHRTPSQLAQLIESSPSQPTTVNITKTTRTRRTVKLSEDGISLTSLTSNSHEDN